jgi:hypothetical protein
MTANEVQLMIVFEWNEWQICSQTVLKVVVVVEEVLIEEWAVSEELVCRNAAPVFCQVW